jgi:hypothetical protein
MQAKLAVSDAETDLSNIRYKHVSLVTDTIHMHSIPSNSAMELRLNLDGKSTLLRLWISCTCCTTSVLIVTVSLLAAAAAATAAMCHQVTLRHYGIYISGC